MSDDVEHTPGPWREENAIIESDHKHSDAHIDEIAAVFCTRPNHLSESRANMQLIAAAPDYHEASVKKRDTQHGTDLTAPELLRLAGGRVKGDLATACYDLAEDLEHAIEKAEGRNE